jgi:glucose/arabinose dehydrogenase
MKRISKLPLLRLPSLRSSIRQISISLSLLGLVACATAPPPTDTAPTAESPDLVTQEPSPQAAQDSAANSIALENRGTGEACQFVESGFGAQGQVNVRAEEVVSGLEVPWGIVFLENGDLLVSERPGRIRLVQNGELQPNPVATVRVTASGEGGLLDIEAHPDFANNRLFYVYYTADRNGSPVNLVERWQLSEDNQTATPDRIIIDSIPVARFHNGGRLEFGPDNMLYIGTGDASAPDIAQDPNSLGGKILRVTPDGDVPSDNPFGNNPVFITGLRNTQGFDWFNESTLWVTDHGPSGELGGRRGQDKVIVATAGDNLGWPILQGCDTEDGLLAPALIWQEAVPPGGAAIYTGNAIPEWQGDLIIGTLGSEHLHRVAFDPEAPYRVQTHEVYFAGTDSLGRIREVVMSPDGELYITTSNCDGRGICPPDGDKIVRITR